jgi:hypothetical protein
LAITTVLSAIIAVSIIPEASFISLFHYGDPCRIDMPMQAKYSR